MINREEYNENEKRNLRFYKLLGQNHEVIVNAILRGKDINYEVPSKYQLNTKKPLILDWLLAYGRPNEISKVRSVGNAKVLCMYNALVSWCEQNPSDLDRWIYKDEWETYFKENPKAKEAPKRTNKTKVKVNKIEQNPVQVVKPHFNFVTKKGNLKHTSLDGDVYISIYNHYKVTTKVKLVFHIRRNLHERFGSDYVIFARHENRLYFKASNYIEGFKIYRKSKNATQFHTIIQVKDLPTYEPFVHKELDLKYDEIYEMYYVEI